MKSPILTSLAVETSLDLIDWTPMDGSTVTTSHNGAGMLTVTLTSSLRLRSVSAGSSAPT